MPGTEQTSLTLANGNEEKLLAAARQNLRALRRMIDYCGEQGVSLLRISSDVIPLASHPRVTFDWRGRLEEEIAEASAAVRTHHVRVSMHPGQYTVLNSPKAEVIAHALADLGYHAEFLQALGTDTSSKIILHLGGVYNNRESALERLAEHIQALPGFVRDRLALENDERNYTIQHVVDICERFSLPAVFDVLHHELNPPFRKETMYWLDRAAATWSPESGRPKIHYSQQAADSRPGAHSPSIGMRDFLAFHRSLGNRDLDVMLEVKDKNLSAVKCANLTASGLPAKRLLKKLTDEWARYKYLVLERDAAAYQAIRDLFRAGTPDAETFYALIEKALAQKSSAGQSANAAQHVWGYLDGFATELEKRRVLEDVGMIAENPAALPRLKRRLLALARKHDVAYLLNSLYFYV